MANFETYLAKLLPAQGGFVDNPNNPGGATNMGISLSQWNEYAQQLLGIAPSLETLKAMTQAQAGVLYKALNWDYFDGDAITDQLIAQSTVDFGVVFGNELASCRAEEVLQLTADGMQFGPLVLAKINESDPQQLLTRLENDRKTYIQQLVASRPALAAFEQGWLARITYMSGTTSAS